ncbi:murein transglycosylase A [Buchnera aphidicola (Aphis fabae)]|uniref:peptidoglycan lytic exotransglycosylase n=1 Tax=Buchnera aphidicola (Aphis fabae) TaxID=571430 RepID=A0A5J6ZCX0_9GAMM|nr:murein transglycosylase A [Buchnera aphidicola]QFQ32617.1 murein transglycosylase A [Buchnera aphidicola (Aphis fabae)]
MINYKTFKLQNKKNIKKIILNVIFIFIISCNNYDSSKGQQYQKKITNNFTETKKINIKTKLINQKDFIIQLEKIKKFSPNLYLKNSILYNNIKKWLKTSDLNTLNKFGIKIFQMKGVDNYGNVKITGYYTPIIQARKIKKDNFIYPIYQTPSVFKKNQILPQRKDIYNGILKKKYILAYSNSLIDNFIMEIQGSGFIDYGNGNPLTFFSYAKKNNWPYTSIGRILIKRGEISKKNISMQSIKNWCSKHTNLEVQKLLEENKSFVFFKETKMKEVFGSSAVPLIAKSAIAVDKSIIKNGSILLVQIPLLDKKGVFINKYEMRLLCALDVGGMIKGQHFDIYQGIGEQAGIQAGFYNHYGNAWILKTNLKTTKN